MQKQTKRKNSYSNRITNYYPVFINLTGEDVIVVGGGSVAERKVSTLIKAGAAVTVISPSLTKRLLAFKRKGAIQHINRHYRKGDAGDCLLVMAATDDPDVNAQIAAETHALVNVADMPEACSFIVPSVVKRGPLTIAISTGGASPALSKTIRRELESLYGIEIGRYLKFVYEIRKKAITAITDKNGRRKFLRQLASEQTLKLLREKGAAAVMDMLAEDLERLTSRSS